MNQILVLELIVIFFYNQPIEIKHIGREEKPNPSISIITDVNSSSDKTQSVQIYSSTRENIQMSPITSDEEDDSVNEGENNLKEGDNNSKSKKYSLEELLQEDDLEKLEEYVNSQFANLSQEEIIQKLMSLDENNRAKLLNLIMKYQQRIANSTQHDKNDDDDEIIEEGNEIPDSDRDKEEIMDVDEINESENLNEKYQEHTGKKHNLNYLLEVKTSSNTRINDHLSYLGFSSSNSSTDLLKKEILKNQNQGQLNLNVDTNISEDIIKNNINVNLNVNMQNTTPQNQIILNQIPYVNMNYPLMNMNQAYMINPNYPQNINYHQMSGMRPNMQVMMGHGVNHPHGPLGSHMGNFNQIQMQNINNPPTQTSYNFNRYNQSNMNQNIQNSKKS
jgi:hypothetical protein